jgi:ankyrin repeat protein
MIKKRAKPVKSSVAPRDSGLDALLDITTCDAEGRTPLHLAAFRGYAVTVRKMLLQHADANARDHTQRTPGHWSSFKGYLDIVTMLVASGADVNARDSEGRTLLRMAVIGRQTAVESFLNQHGATL